MTNIKTVLSGVVDVQLATIQKLNNVNNSLSGYELKSQFGVLSTTFLRNNQDQTLSGSLTVNQNLNVSGTAAFSDKVLINESDILYQGNASNTSGGFAIVQNNGVLPSSIMNPEVFNKIELIQLNNVDQPISNKTVNLAVIEQPLNSSVGQFLQRTATGWQGAEGLATVQQEVSTVSDNKIQVKNSIIPVMLKTNKGNIYPIQKTTLTQSGNYFYIDVTNYLVYDNSASFTGTWKVYFGAGVAQRNTNTIYNGGTISSGTYTANYALGDIHTIVAAGSIKIVATNIPQGQGMTIRIQNSGNYSILFGDSLQIISSSGNYVIPIGNFTGTAQLIGGAIELK